MKAPRLVGTMALSLLLGGCAAQSPSEPQSQTSAAAAPTPAETKLGAEAPRQVAKEDLIFHTADGNTATFEELSQEHKLLTSEYPNRVDVTRSYLEVEMPNMIEYFPTADEVRNNLGYSASKVLTKEDYLMAAAIGRQTYDIAYVITPEETSKDTNSIFDVMNRIANTAVSKRYDANGGDAANEAVPFTATIEVAGIMNSFTYYDNSFNTTPDVYGIAGKDPQRTTEKEPAWKIDPSMKLKALN